MSKEVRRRRLAKVPQFVHRDSEHQMVDQEQQSQLDEFLQLVKSETQQQVGEITPGKKSLP